MHWEDPDFGRFVGNGQVFSVNNVLNEEAVNQFSRILGAEEVGL